MPYNNTPIAPSKEVTGHVSLPLARVQKIIQADPERLTTSKNAAFAIALATEMFIQHLATTTHNVVKAERKPRRNIQYRDVSSAIAKTDNLEFLVDVVPKTTTYKDFKKKQEEKERAKGKEGETEQEKEKGKEKEKEKEKEKKEGTNGQANGDGQTTLAGVVGRQPEEPANGTAQDRPAPIGNNNGNSTFLEIVQNPQETPDAMEVDSAPQPTPLQSVLPQPVLPQPILAQPILPQPILPQPVPARREESEPEDDAAAMQIEMEMRGPPRPTPTASPEIRRTSGFTAVNGTK